MTDLEVRRPRFDFTGEPVPWQWNPASPAFSFYMNATSIIAVCFEQMIVAAVGEAKPLIADAEVAAEATAFLRQEAQHSASHRKHVNALTARYPGLSETVDAAMARFDELTETTPLEFRLAYIADLEATFTPTFKMMLDNEATLFRPGDERVASLFLWHFVEEVEHRSSALVIYDWEAGYRSFLGADPTSAYRFKDQCDKKFVFESSFVVRRPVYALGDSLGKILRSDDGALEVCIGSPAADGKHERCHRDRGQNDLSLDREFRCRSFGCILRLVSHVNLQHASRTQALFLKLSSVRSM